MKPLLSSLSVSHYSPWQHFGHFYSLYLSKCNLKQLLSLVLRHTWKTAWKHAPSWFQTQFNCSFCLCSELWGIKCRDLPLSYSPFPGYCACVYAHVCSNSKGLNESKNNCCQIKLIKFKLQSIKTALLSSLHTLNTHWDCAASLSLDERKVLLTWKSINTFEQVDQNPKYFDKHLSPWNQFVPYLNVKMKTFATL